MFFFAHTPSLIAPQNWHGLRVHLQKVAYRAKVLTEKLGVDDVGYYCGLWHDLGKYNPIFQDYLQACHDAQKSNQLRPNTRVPHAIYGAKLAVEVAGSLGSAIAPLIAGHHIGLQSPGQLRQALKAVDQQTYQTILDHAQSESLSLNLPASTLQGLTNHLNPIRKDPHKVEVLLRLLFSCLVDADYLDTESHFEPQRASLRGTRVTVHQLWETLDQAQTVLLQGAEPTTVNHIRAEVYRHCLDAAIASPGVFRLVVPTGGGKTRSGLAFALAHGVEHDLDRVIVAVPYTSIIEQTVDVYRGIFSELGSEAVLEHHSAVEPDRCNEEDARSRQAQARLATQNWDAPLVVTTTVQLFESLFSNRTSRCRKLHNIVNSVIILDEVQTLPIGLLQPILSMLQELCQRYRVSVVLCTATQPALEGTTPYLKGFATDTVCDVIPEAVVKRHFTALKRVHYQFPAEMWDWAEVAQQIANQAQALVILNTRKDALVVLDEVLGSADIGNRTVTEVSEDAVFHLSTLLCGKHRREVLQEVRDRLQSNQPCLLISTQVVEAGVDLDFPVVYRAMGPLDRIVQAAGRCNREGRRQEKGRVVVFKPQTGKVPPGEYRTAVEETEILLKNADPDLADPMIFERYFHQVYQDVDTDAYKIQHYRERLDFPEVAARFKMIPDDATPVVITYDDEAQAQIQTIRRYGLRSGDLRRLQPYLVNLRQREFQDTVELREELAPGLWLWQGNYDSKQGIAIGDRAIIRDPADLIF